MSTLKGLGPAARSLVTEDFRKGDPATVDAGPYLVDDFGLGRVVSLDLLRAVVGEGMKRFRHEPWKSDPWLSPRVHATLRLTRREAADKRIWEYLTVVKFPDYVRWRWAQEKTEEAVPAVRFCGLEQKNSFARLWWTAELTRNGCDYRHTEMAFKVSDFSDRWQGYNLMHHRAAALGTVEFLSNFGSSGVTTTQNKAISKAFNMVLRTMCLDALVGSPPTDAEAVREWIAEKIDETTMMDELPKGPDEAPVSDADIAIVRKFLDDLAERIKLAEVKADRRPAAATE
jgi:alkanesulfonate monooxygenase SsuD/methylene tetrahydromethanopterin reductase-like flavin-dependent oxidoreductase (luciferase family)